MGFLGPNTLSNYNVFDRLAGPSEATAERPDDYPASPRGRIPELWAGPWKVALEIQSVVKQTHGFRCYCYCCACFWGRVDVPSTIYSNPRLCNPRKVKA